MLLGHTAYAATLGLVCCLTWIGELSPQSLAIYSTLLIATTLSFMLMIRLGKLCTNPTERPVAGPPLAHSMAKVRFSPTMRPNLAF